MSNMKKKLLITLGCSFTEGVGCYDPELLKQYPVINEKIKGDIYNKSIGYFHANGWPPRLQQKLNYDRLINLYEYANPLLEQTREHWKYALDQIWNDLNPTSKWYSFTQRIGIQRPSFSDNSNQWCDLQGL